MTEDEKKQKWREYEERKASERIILMNNGVFTDEQAKAIQQYVEFYFYKRPTT